MTFHYAGLLKLIIRGTEVLLEELNCHLFSLTEDAFEKSTCIFDFSSVSQGLCAAQNFKFLHLLHSLFTWVFIPRCFSLLTFPFLPSQTLQQKLLSLHAKYPKHTKLQTALSKPWSAPSSTSLRIMVTQKDINISVCNRHVYKANRRSVDNYPSGN